MNKVPSLAIAGVGSQSSRSGVVVTDSSLATFHVSALGDVGEEQVGATAQHGVRRDPLALGRSHGGHGGSLGAAAGQGSAYASGVQIAVLGPVEVSRGGRALDLGAPKPRRLLAALVLGSAGALGLILASVGLYGVLLYTVSRRVREIGVRVALGATPGNILKLVLRHSLTLVGAGTAVGLILAVIAVRPLAAYLVPDVRPGDPLNFLAVVAVLTVVALVATAAPAIRALRIDPLHALRHE